MAVRMIFDPRMSISMGNERYRAIKAKLYQADYKSTDAQKGDRLTIIVNTDRPGHAVLSDINADNRMYITCLVCKTVHFRLPSKIKEPFECPCGKTINK